MVKVTIYLEGGGSDSKELKTRCREAFSELFKKCELPRQPAFVACGGRDEAFKRFCIAHSNSKAQDSALLLIDSEDPMSPIEQTWNHLKVRDPSWIRPDKSSDDQVLMMTTCMETWIIADRETLKEYYGSEFKENKLPSPVGIESRDRHAVQDSLRAATKDCKNRYEKGKQSFLVLAVITPAALAVHLPSFVRDLRILKEKLK
jgi:hypothetical protein